MAFVNRKAPIEVSCLCGLLRIGFGLPLKLPTIVYDVLNWRKHACHVYLNLRLKGLDKKCKTHSSYTPRPDISFFFETRNLQHSPLEGFSYFSLVLKTGRESSYGRIKAQMAAVMKYSGTEISCVIKRTRTVGFFPVPEVTTNIHVVQWLLNFGHNIFKKECIHNTCTVLIVGRQVRIDGN